MEKMDNKIIDDIYTFQAKLNSMIFKKVVKKDFKSEKKTK